MIVDLTQELKKQFQNYPQNNNPHLLHQLSPKLKLFSSFCQSTFKSLQIISNSLASNRQNFFSNAAYSYEAFTDRQRIQLAQSTKMSLDDVSAQINQLNQQVKNKSGFHNKTQHEHSKALILCLYAFFVKIKGVYFQYQQFNRKRKKKLQQAILIDKQSQKTKINIPKAQKENNIQINENLEKQKHLLYLQKVEKDKKLQQTRKQIQDLHEMMGSMSNIVLEQQLKTSAFLQIGQVGLIHIDKGNKNLVQADLLAKTTGKWWSLLFLSMAFSLLILDFLKS